MEVVGLNEKGERRRFNLTKATPLGISVREGLWGLGVSLEEVYLLPSGRVLLQTFSIWEDPRAHTIVGRQYSIAGPQDVARLAELTEDPRLISLVEEAE